MAFVALNGYDVEHASQLLVYENLFPAIQHINGKGCTDKYTNTSDVESVTYIDVLRVLPYGPRFRQLGASNNGKWYNSKNVGGYNNAAQSTKYTIPVDLIYDEGVPIMSTQDYSNGVNLKAIIMAQLIQSAALSINVATFAKQFVGYFRDSFTKSGDHPTTESITDAELAEAVFACDATLATNAAGSYADAFIAANSTLTNGVPEIGALIVPMEERQAFITAEFDRILKRQYSSNASEAAARILANGYINPFTDTAEERIDAKVGLAGTYDGVDLFLYNKVTNAFVEVALGISANAGAKTLFEKLRGFIVYGAGTCRGIVGPSVEVNKQVTQNGVYVVPRLKMGVDVLSGKTIKIIVDGGWTKANIVTLEAAISFTPIDGSVVTGNNVLGTGVFNDGTSN